MNRVGGALTWLRAVRAEGTKSRTIAGTSGLASAAIVGMVTLGALITTSVDVGDCRSPSECVEDTTRLSLSGVHVAQLVLAVLAVLMVTDEYSSGMVRTTLLAMPGRLRVVTAKAMVLAGVALGVGAVAALGSLFAARLILPGNGFAPPSLGQAATARAVGGTVLYLGLVALLSLGVALLVRDAAVALTVVAALLYLAPVLAQFAPPDLAEVMLTYAPMNAGLAVQDTLNLPGALIGPWAGLGVLGVWAGVFLAAGAARFALADAAR